MLGPLLAVACLARAIWLPMHLAGEAHAGHGEHLFGSEHDLAIALGHPARPAAGGRAHDGHHHPGQHPHDEGHPEDHPEDRGEGHGEEHEGGHDPHPSSDHLLELLPDRKPGYEGIPAVLGGAPGIALLVGAPPRAEPRDRGGPRRPPRHEIPRKRGPPRA